MSDNETVTMPVDTEAEQFAQAVRGHLSDLPVDDVDELMQDVTANLDDVAKEQRGTLGERLGTPAEYAAELRSAAGLTASRSMSNPVPAVPLAERLRTRGRQTVARWPWLLDLRPVWWIVRGLVAGWAFCAVFLREPSIVIAVIGAATSFWLGRSGGSWSGWQARTRTVVNIVAVVALAPTMAWAGSAHTEPNPTYYQETTPGLAVDGIPVTQLYGYDATGKALDRVRLFDQDGRPVAIDGSEVPTDESAGDNTSAEPITVFPHTVGVFDGWRPVPLGYDLWIAPTTVSPLLPESSTGSQSTTSPSPNPPSAATSAPSSAPAPAATRPSSTTTP